MLEGADEEAAGASGRIADQLPFLRVEHVHHELDDRARREELAELAAEGRAEEALEGEALDVVDGLRQVAGLKLLHDAAEGVP